MVEGSAHVIFFGLCNMRSTRVPMIISNGKLPHNDFFESR